MLRREILKTGLLASFGFLNKNKDKQVDMKFTMPITTCRESIWLGVDPKLLDIFHKADNTLYQMFRAKTNNLIWTLHGCERDKNGCPVFADEYLYRQRRYGFYAFMDLKPIDSTIRFFNLAEEVYYLPDFSMNLDKIQKRYSIHGGCGELGASWDAPGYLTQKEYDVILRMFADKYKLPETSYEQPYTVVK